MDSVRWRRRSYLFLLVLAGLLGLFVMAYQTATLAQDQAAFVRQVRALEVD